MRRDRTGEGAFLDAAGADAVIAQGWIGAVYGWNESRADRSRRPAAPGTPAFNSARYQYYATSDARFVLFCAIEPKFWRRFCAAVDRPDLVGGGVSDGAPVDFAHGDEQLRRELQAMFADPLKGEWLELAQREDMPIGPANQGVGSLLDDAHLRARNIIVDGEHPASGRSRTSARR